MRWRDGDGLRYSAGPQDGHEQGVYSLMGTLMEFPEHSDVSVGLVRQAAREFLLSGGERPACAAWQEDPDS
ncbi:Imm1 family immunity protein [Actinoplanes sp. DH11]|uniref:Imm1 family immunity protein n=1 Tax=Actinoplanes sp. DH11 TaxID=2857011 RepID=UPI001E2C7E81|nr:Imm1 family immunity protein [Actinoplanes sp. DH11]